MPPPENPLRDPVRSRGRTPFAGATLVNMSPAVADELQIDVADDGVVLAELEERSDDAGKRGSPICFCCSNGLYELTALFQQRLACANRRIRRDCYDAACTCKHRRR